MRKLIISLAILAVSAFTATTAKADIVIDGVTDCAVGQMTYDDNGWLIDYQTMDRVDYHQIAATSPNNAMSDEIWTQSINGATVKVCKNDAKLVYTAQRHITLANTIKYQTN